jgi:cyanophycinase
MLALVGSGEYLPPVEPIDRYLLAMLPSQPRVVCLPTAAGSEGAERIAYWSALGVNYFTGLGVRVEALAVIDQPSANDPELANRIAAANFIYLSGGRPDYLLNTLRGSLAWKAIGDVLATGGILAGCSAGAMILGERIPAFPGWRKAFSLLPGVIVPHFDEIPPSFSRPMKWLVGKGSTLVGIEANTALIHHEGQSIVVGSGGVTLWDNLHKQRYTHEQMLPWPEAAG